MRASRSILTSGRAFGWPSRPVNVRPCSTNAARACAARSQPRKHLPKATSDAGQLEIGRDLPPPRFHLDGEVIGRRRRGTGGGTGSTRRGTARSAAERRPARRMELPRKVRRHLMLKPGITIAFLGPAGPRREPIVVFPTCPPPPHQSAARDTGAVRPCPPTPARPRWSKGERGWSRVQGHAERRRRGADGGAERRGLTARR